MVPALWRSGPAAVTWLPARRCGCRPATFEDDVMPLVPHLLHGGTAHDPQPEDAEDVLQETLLGPTGATAPFKAGTKPAAWLYASSPTLHQPIPAASRQPAEWSWVNWRTCTLPRLGQEMAPPAAPRRWRWSASWTRTSSGGRGSPRGLPHPGAPRRRRGFSTRRSPASWTCHRHRDVAAPPGRKGAAEGVVGYQRAASTWGRRDEAQLR